MAITVHLIAVTPSSFLPLLTWAEVAISAFVIESGEPESRLQPLAILPPPAHPEV